MKKIILIIALSFAVVLMAQQNDNQKQKTETSEIPIQQKMDKEVNSLTRDMLDNRERTLANENQIKNLFITKISAQGLIIALFTGILSFLGVGVFLKKYYLRKINKDIIVLKEENEKAIERVYEVKTETIQRIQNTEIENADLRAQSQILLVSETSTPVNQTIEHIFEKNSAKVTFNCTHIRIKELSFKQVEVALANKGNIHPSDFKLMILDNCDAEGRKWKGDDFNTHILNFTEEFLKREIGVLFFSNDQHFPSNTLDFRTLPNKHLLDYAKSHAHVYTNAMNVLKLQNLYA